MDPRIPWLLLTAAVAYLFGSFPTAYLVTKGFAGKNVLDYGTGNVGSMNVFRITQSKGLLLLTAAGDMLKGVIPFLGARYLFHIMGMGYDEQLAGAVGGVMAVVGHNYSVFLRFKGGKGLATGLPIVLLTQPWLVVAWVVVFLAMVGITRFMVLGQILGTVAVPIAAYIWFPQVWVFMAVLGTIIFIRHASRLKDVVQGKEPKMYYKLRSQKDEQGPPSKP